MENVPGYEHVVAQDDLWEHMEENERFNVFVGQCITHFANFVVPRRDWSIEIAQDYKVPTDIEDVGGNVIMITRRPKSVEIFVEFWRW